ncbi:hypothetical protein B7Y92_01955 [Candidatus Saccharibacteria bacterium 32-50-13]|nr:MAG: hypothetical protein B7Y92_01955 [Candidatus Saccharibacteria bacterium 32-50-13]
MPYKAHTKVPYEDPRVMTLGTTDRHDDGALLYAVSFMTFSDDAEACWPVLGEILRGYNNLATGPHASMGRIARVEFIWDRPTSRRGAVFFDDKGVPVIHAVNALLGYDGSGSKLSRRILTVLGLPDPVFDAINAEVANQDYIVVVSREEHIEVDGVMHALPMMVADTWKWHPYEERSD